MGKLGRKFTKVVVKNLGVEVDVYVSRDGEFAAEYQDTVHRNMDVNLLKKGVEAAISQGSDLNWIPVIEIDIKKVGHQNYDAITAGSEIEVKRYYMCRNHTNTSWLQSGWDVPADKRASTANGHSLRYYQGGDIPFFRPTTSGYGSMKETKSIEAIMPYTEETYQVLKAFQEGLKNVSVFVMEMLTPELFLGFHGRVQTMVDVLPKKALLDESKAEVETQ